MLDHASDILPWADSDDFDDRFGLHHISAALSETDDTDDDTDDDGKRADFECAVELARALPAMSAAEVTVVSRTAERLLAEGRADLAPGDHWPQRLRTVTEAAPFTPTQSDLLMGWIHAAADAGVDYVVETQRDLRSYQCCWASIHLARMPPEDRAAVLPGVVDVGPYLGQLDPEGLGSIIDRVEAARRGPPTS